MANLPFMPFFIGDYLGDTRHLSTVQHGIYLLQLMHHWRTGPLPDDDILLARIAGYDPGSYVRWHAKILRAFYTPTPEGLIQKRLMKEREHALEISTKRTEAGRLGGRPRQHHAEGNGQTNSFANANQKPSKAKASTTTSTTTEEKRGATHPARDTRARECVPSPGFDEFWETYPRKQAQGRAEIAYARAIADTDPAIILAAVKAWGWPVREQFIPYACNWLDGRCWRDEPPLSDDEKIFRALSLNGQEGLLQ